MGLIQCCDKERVEKRSRIVNIKNILESAPPPEFPNRPDTEKRHGIKPTDEERDFVITAIVLGVPRATIASLLHIGEDSLRKHYRAELEYGKQIFGIEAVAALFSLGLATNSYYGSSIWGVANSCLPLVYYCCCWINLGIAIIVCPDTSERQVSHTLS
jgi:hypothetical protein